MCMHAHIYTYTREHFPQEGNRSAWNPFNYNSCDIGQDDRYYPRQSINLVRDSLVGL